MASTTIGAAKSNKFQIGAAEIRIGPLSRAGQLTSNDSVGLLQSASVNFTNESVDLEGGLPKTLIDTVIVKQTATVQASAYEYTTNNIRVMLNAGVGVDTRPDFALQLKAQVAAAGTSLVFDVPTNLTVVTTDSPAGTLASTNATLGTLYAYDGGTKVMEISANNPVKYFIAGKEFVAVPSAGSVSVSGSQVTITLTVPAVPTTIPANTTVSSTSIMASSAGASDLYEGTVATAVTNPTATTTLDTNIPLSAIQPGDMLVAYPAGQPHNMSVISVQSAATVSGKTQITLGGGSKLLFPLSVGDVVYKADSVALGANTTTQYFALDVITSDHATGRPTGFRFWKAAVSSGLDFSYSSDNFGTTPLSFKILKPSDADITTGDLSSVASQIGKNPYGIYF